MTVKEMFQFYQKQMETMGIADCEASDIILNSQPITEPVDGIIPGAQLNRIKGYAFALNFCVMNPE